MTALLERVAKAASTTAFGLSAAAVAFFLLAAALVVGFLFWQTNNLLTNQVLGVLTAEARILSSEMKVGGRAKLAETVAAMSHLRGTGLYYLADAGGVKIAGNLNRIPPELTEDTHGGVFSYQPAGDDSASHLAVAIPVDLGSDVRLIVGRDIEDQRAFADSIRLAFLLGFGVLSVAGLLGGLAVSRLILNRMDAITATSRSIIDGDLTRRIPTSGSGGELDALAGNLNEMLDRIEGLMSGLREVSDNIAHDLKTPLNRLRNSAEAALRDPRGAEAYREGLERTIEKSDELIKTFNALLLIARLEAGPLEESVETFDLGRFVEDVTELYMPAAEEAGFALSIEAEKNVFVRANRQLIGQAVANLIDNAIKYSRGGEPGSAITVRAYREEGRPAFSVGDHGPGIAADDRERALKRFVRLEASRTQPGTGLGLSLVAAVARLHHGEVRLEDNQPGLKVAVLLSGKCMIAASPASGSADSDVSAGIAAQ
ncbi:integral membrane sensor signal transduction histidine kinase [Hyphomicrobium denitrificans 1NES1]|uniref:histidine kinase n=1 Tax=Hyphomicrobium denitrificans 1NES1 TaxID=670307 RepID=N0BC39_9HYPH|nr:ATP-binding protein [Hyphomicrobium denitrificans]AGK58071.1 integral membrane sensor signal transduction histidine kinase [Hyphomicrobium denitrificans 1NES1]